MTEYRDEYNAGSRIEPDREFRPTMRGGQMVCLNCGQPIGEHKLGALSKRSCARRHLEAEKRRKERR